MDQKQYITKDSVRDMIMGWSGGFDYIEEPVEGALEDLRGIPTVDAVPVVRCKDCRWHENEEPGMVWCPYVIGSWVSNNWYCAYGERKGGDHP